MDIMKLNGFSIKPLKKGYYAVVNDNNKKLIYISRNVSQCIAYINMQTKRSEEEDGKV